MSWEGVVKPARQAMTRIMQRRLLCPREDWLIGLVWTDFSVKDLKMRKKKS